MPMRSRRWGDGGVWAMAAIAQTSWAIPGQPHAVASIRGFARDAVDVAPVVHGNVHGTAQPTVLGGHVGLQPSPLFGDQDAIEHNRAAAVYAERDHDPAAAVDIHTDIREPLGSEFIERRLAAPTPLEVHYIVPTETRCAA